MSSLELKNVSPALVDLKDLELAVPGTYKAQHEVIRISRFHPVLSVFSTKQKPRRLTIYGSDGLDWDFLLKSHEDLRQDERVMQLFGLVNNLLKADGTCHILFC